MRVAKRMPNPSERAMGIRNLACREVSKIIGVRPPNVVNVVRMTGRKRRALAALIQRKPVEEALNILHFSVQRSSVPLEKTIRSAVANALQKEGEDEGHRSQEAELEIKEIRIDGGPMRKWILPRAMGRATRIRRRTSHITVVVG